MADSNIRFSDDLSLKYGISLSQARFALSHFCLSHFGADGQYFADVIELCLEANQLQEVVLAIRDEVRARCADQLPALVTCVREANDDGKTSVARPAVPQPARPALSAKA